MKITDSNQQRNPDQISQQLTALVDQLKLDVKTAAKHGNTFDSVERSILTSVLKIGDQAVELLLALQGDGDLGEQIQNSDGKASLRSQTKAATRLRSIFGEHSFEQFTYSPGKNKTISLRPISARLSLPASRWSFLLQEFSQMLGVDQAYDQAMKNLGQFLGSNFSVDTAERINGRMGSSAAEFLADLPLPKAGSEGKLLVATADCKGVPLVKNDSKKVAAFETAKKNPGNRRMATVTSVYSVEPHIRTAQEIVAALFRDERDEDLPKKDRPRPSNKNTTAHFPETSDNGVGGEIAISGIHVGMAWIFDQVAARRRSGQVLIALMDGQEGLWETMQLHLNFSARTVPILDILHALAYVWEAASLFERDEPKRRAFTRDRLLKILGGEVTGVVQGLRSLGTRRGLTGDRLRSLERICSYLAKNASRMRYDEYLRRGYPIASGVIEGACRHLVKDRMERSGMRWTLEGARSMLNIRAAFQSDHWRTYLDWHMQNEVRCTHPNRNLLKDYTPHVLAC
jgi:plasmid stability protein